MHGRVVDEWHQAMPTKTANPPVNGVKIRFLDVESTNSINQKGTRFISQTRDDFRHAEEKGLSEGFCFESEATRINDCFRGPSLSRERRAWGEAVFLLPPDPPPSIS